MNDPIIIGHGFRQKLQELKEEMDRRLMSCERDPVVEPAPDPATNIPCPFCGGVGKVTSRVHSGHGDCTCEVFVQCSSCSSRGPDTGYWGQPTDEQKQKAVALWEKRAIKTSEI